VDNQLVQSQVWLNRLILIVMAVMLVVGISILGVYWQINSDPYVQAVLSLEGKAPRGLAMFQINCAGCHSRQTDGSVGPSLKNVAQRKSKIDLIKQVTSGKTPPMPKFQPNQQEMADLLAYLSQI
jgi:mono/diheme cytochrome c family protein